MKKIFSVMMMLCISMCCMFVKSEVIKFLGIPVDGTKEEMIQKLKAKGFTNSNECDLEGIFNGEDVCLDILTNNSNKVFCIALADKDFYTEEGIRMRFNKLCKQFESSGKYMPFIEGNSNQQISENEDVAYEMSVHHKEYFAFYVYALTQEEITLKQEKLAKSLYRKKLSEISNPSEKEKIMQMTTEESLNDRVNNKVFFKIHQVGYQQYIILMFYKNDSNYYQANGEDL